VGLSSFAQKNPVRGKANFEKRNTDFIERRTTESPQNFAKNYFTAYQSIKDNGSLDKSSKQWLPRGPFGKETLAGTGRVNTMQFHPKDTNTWFICVAQGGVWKTTNAGESWLSISNDLPILRTSYLSIHPNNPDTMYLALGDFAYLGHNLQANENKRNSHYGLGVYKTIDGGDHWFPTGLSFLQTDFEGSLIAKVLINQNNPEQITAVGQTGCYVSNNGGAQWTKTHSGLFWDLEYDPASDSILYATTGYVDSYDIGEVSLLKSYDFGKTWEELSTNIPKTNKVQRVELAISPSDPNYVYAIACDDEGGFYGFYQSTNAGKTFVEKLQANSYEYNLLNHSLDDEPGGQGRYDLGIVVDRNDRNKVLIGGINVWQTTNGGNSFEPLTYWLLNYYQTSLHADIHELVQHPTNSSFFACHDGGLSRTFKTIPDKITTLKDERKASTEWTNYTNGLSITSFYRLSVNDNNPAEFIAGAQDNSTVYTNGSGFRNLSGGDGMESVFDDDNYYRYTSSQNGRIYVYDYSFSEMIYDGDIYTPSGEVGEWTTPMVRAKDRLFVLYGNLYSYSGRSRLNKKTNFPPKGTLWFPTPGSALTVQKSDFKHLYLAKRPYSSKSIDNEIWASHDGGKNWTDISNGLPRNLYPSYLEMSQRNPRKVWITFSGFDSAQKVYQSDDRGMNWTNITYDLPNIPVNCIVHQNDGSDYVYIGTDLGVYYLPKDSSHWIRYSENLPKVIVSELEIDSTEKKLVAATFGRGVWDVDLLEYKDTSTVSYEEVKPLSLELSITPNPSSDYFVLTWDKPLSDGSTLIILDITGRIVHREELYSNSEQSMKLDFRNYPMGEYFVVIENLGRRSSTRLLKQ